MLRHIKSCLSFTIKRHVVAWCAVTLACFLLVRCSEYLGEGTRFGPRRALTTEKLLPHLNEVPLDPDEFEKADSLTALFEVSKNDQGRVGCTRMVYGSGDDLCPIEAWKALRRARSDDWHPLQPVMQIENWTMSREVTTELLKAAAVDFGIPTAEYATHSLRIGGATTMAATGKYTDDEVRRFGRWLSDCWRRYVHAARNRVRDLAAARLRVEVVPEYRNTADFRAAAHQV